MQLQESSAEFEALGIDILSVHREEKEGTTGLEKTAKKSAATYHLTTDHGKKSTVAYSPEGFDSYLIGKNGKILAVLQGVKYDRPTATEILTEARKHLPPAPAG